MTLLTKIILLRSVSAQIARTKILIGLLGCYPDGVHVVWAIRHRARERRAYSGGKVRFGSGSVPFALNAEPEPGVRFRRLPNLEPERRFRFGSAFERVRT